MGWNRQWDNRKEAKAQRLPTINGRTWTRRVQWLDMAEGTVKLKFWEGEAYSEYVLPEAFAQTAWDRFKAGQSAQEAVSILGREPLPHEQSRKASQQ